MFSIYFNFDPESSKISNLKVIKVNEEKDNAIVTVEDNKLVLTKEAVKLLGAAPNDRLTVGYWTKDEKETFPLIAKSEVFTDTTGGNRLTKSNTVSFRGTQKDILLEYGSIFKLEPFNSYFKMVKLDEVIEHDDLSEEETDLTKLED